MQPESFLAGNQCSGHHRSDRHLHRQEPGLHFNSEISAATGQLVADLLLHGGQLDQPGTERNMKSSPMVEPLSLSSMAPPATARTKAPLLEVPTS
jgi:hypothetical protein